jgi:catechol 2,3-dioxygenase
MGHVHLHVGSLEAAEAFYHRAIGFDKTVWSYPGALFLSAGGYHHHLGTNIWSPGPRPSPAQAQLLEWEIIVPADDDVAAVQRSLKDAGYQAEEAEDGLTAVDPWGTAVRIGTGPAVRPKGI